MWRTEWTRRVVLVALLGASAGIAWYTDSRRPTEGTHTDRFAIEVTSGGDRGPGTLREAIFTAVQSRSRAHIVLRVPRVTLTDPLPPLTHHVAFVIDADALSTIDATALSVDAVLDFRAPEVELRSVAIVGAPQIGVLLNASRVSLANVEIDDADVGVAFAAMVAHFTVRDSQFTRNRIAIQSSVVAEGVISGSKFADNSGTAVWIVGAIGDTGDQRSVRVSKNQFQGDNDSIVIANRTVTLDGNRVTGAAHVAVTLRDAEAVMRDNVIRGARHIGILVEGGSRVDISENEIGASPGTGIVLASAHDARISRNRVYSNLDGIVQLAQLDARPPLIIDNLFYENERDGIRIIGSSPVVRGNRSMHNRGAGLRMIDSVASTGRLLEARPLLDRNVFAGNRSGEMARTQVRR